MYVIETRVDTISDTSVTFINNNVKINYYSVRLNDKKGTVSNSDIHIQHVTDEGPWSAQNVLLIPF